MNDTLQQRQRWFRSFPDGTLEFLLVTRLLAVFLLLALAAMRESQRPMVLLALALVLLADYVLMIWWAVQTAADLDSLSARPSADPPAPVPAAPEPKPRRLQAVALACLPAVVAFVALAPWPDFAISNAVAREGVVRVLRPAGSVAFVLALIVGYWGLRPIRLGPPVWTILLLVPCVHWFAMHRLVSHLRSRLDACRRATGETVTEGPAVALAFADVTWLLAMIPWVVLIIAGMSRAPGFNWRGFLAPCGAGLTAVFAIADMAALEGLQRQVVATIRRLAAPPRA